MTVTKEEVRVKSTELADKVKDLLREGTVRRVIVKDGGGRTIMEIPVTAGVIVAVIAPILTALGAIAALAAEWTIEVQRVESTADAEEKGED